MTSQPVERSIYPTYKPSGVPWLGDVPEHWQPIRLRYRARINPSRSELNGTPGDLDVSFVPMEAVHAYGGLTLEQTRPLTEVATGYTYFRDGDVLSAKITPCFENGKGAIAKDLLNGIGFGTTEVHVLRPCPELDHHFLFYVTISHAFRHLGAAEMYGAGGQKRVPDDFIRDFRQPVPTTQEQQAIAAFLDRETARIDTLIEKKQRQIELLQEKRSALISHAVTKGLISNAPMKDSGIEWLGDVPEHWQPIRLRYRARINPSRSELNGTPGDLDVSFVPMEAVHAYGGLTLEQTRPLTEVATGYTFFRDGDVLSAKITPCFENGKGAIAKDLLNGIGFGTTEVHVLRPCPELDHHFLFYVTISHAFRHLGAAEMYGAGGQKRVPDDFIRDFRQPVPTTQEQQAIAAFLDRETARIDTLIEKKQRQIELLQEKRSALISHAVTKGLISNAPMKDSGIEWLGDVPEHWQPIRLRYRARINPSRSELNGTPGDLDVSFVPMEAVHAYGGLTLEQTRPLTEVATGYTFFRDGDVLSAKITPCFENGKGAIAKDLLNGIGFGTTEVHVLRPCPELDHHFLFYVTISHAFRHLGAAEMYGAGGQKRVPADFIRDFQQPVPPTQEQKAIAAFLDRETARIDALIEKKQRQIELLQEKRSALISHAVTKGLDPNAPMKDSGIEWLGQIPKHWELRRLKFLAAFVTSGSRGWAQHYSDDGAAFIRIGNIDRERIDLRLDDIQYVQPPDGAEGERTRTCPGDVLVSVTAYIGSIGIVPESLKDAYVNQHTALVRIRPGAASARWIAYCLLSKVGHQQFGALEYGGTKVGLSLEDVANLLVLEPPMCEQQAITAHVDKEAGRTDSLVAKVQQSVEKLRVFRSALISAAVTGKIDVRGKVE